MDASLISCLLCLVTVSVFLSVNFLVKLLAMVAAAAVHAAILACFLVAAPAGPAEEHLPDNVDAFVERATEDVVNSTAAAGLAGSATTTQWPFWVGFALMVALLAGLLHLLDRQIELTARSDFLWRAKLSSEEEGVDTMRGINKILLENILPAHVAEHYLLRVQGVAVMEQATNVSKAAQVPVVHQSVHGTFFFDLFLCRRFTAKGTKTSPSCSPPFPTTRSFTTRMTSTSRAWNASGC